MRPSRLGASWRLCGVYPISPYLPPIAQFALIDIKKAPAEAGAQIAKVRVILPPLCQQEVNRKGPKRRKTPNDLSGEYVRTTNNTPQIEISANSRDRLETAAKKKSPGVGRAGAMKGVITVRRTGFMVRYLKIS